MQKENTILQKLFNYVGFFGVFLVSISYVLYSLLTIKETGKTILEIIGEGALAFFAGFSIISLLRVQGVIYGNLDFNVIETRRLHGEKVDQAVPYFGYADEFISNKNVEALKRVRFNFLNRHGISYDDIFDSKGTFKEVRYKDKGTELTDIQIRRNKQKNKIINNVLKLKVTNITLNDLTGDKSDNEDPNNLGTTVEQFLKTQTIKTSISSIISALIFGYYTYDLLEDFSKEDFIWRLLQVSLFITLGLLSMYRSYLFVKGKGRNRTINQINVLDTFIVLYKDKPVKPVSEVDKSDLQPIDNKIIDEGVEDNESITKEKESD